MGNPSAKDRDGRPADGRSSSPTTRTGSPEKTASASQPAKQDKGETKGRTSEKGDRFSWESIQRYYEDR